MTSILQSALARLEQEQRLQSPSFKGATQAPRRFGFRGELVLEFCKVAPGDPPRPELLCRQVLTVGNAGAPTLSFFAGRLPSFSNLKQVASVLSGLLKGGGKYFLFCDDLKSNARYQIPFAGTMWYVLPTASNGVERQLLDLLYLDKPSYAELNQLEQLDAIANAALQYDVTFDMMTYSEGVERLLAR